MKKELQERSDANIKFAAIAKEHSEFHDWINTFDTFVGKFNLNGVGIVFNTALLEAGGVSAEEVVGKYFPDTKWWSHSKMERDRIVQCFERAKAGVSTKIETTIRSADGTSVPIIFNFQPMMEEAGEVKYISAEGKTVIEEECLRARLQEAKETLEIRVRERIAELIETNEKLKKEIAERVRAARELRKHHQNLGELVKDRTGQLTKTNGLLQKEITQRKRAEEQIQQQSDELATLYVVGQDFAGILDLDILLSTIAQRVTDKLGTDQCIVFLFDERVGILRARAIHGYMAERYADFSCRPREEAEGMAYVTRESQYIPDLNLAPDLSLRHDLRTILAIPLLSPTDNPLGVLSFASLRMDAFSPDQQRLMKTIADQTAGVIENARLLQRQQVKASPLRTFNDLMVGILCARALDRTLDSIVQAVADLLGCDMAAVALYDPVTEELRIPVEYGHRGFERTFVEQFSIHPGSGAGGKAFVEGRIGVIPDTKAEGVAIDQVYAELAEIRAMLVGPLQTPERKLGVLYANQHHPYAFSEDEVALFSILTSQAAVAIENTRLYEDLEKRAGLIEEANIRLQEIDRLKSMFIASMSHELRTPLNSIIGFTGIILQGMTGEINAEQTDQLQRVYGSAKHLLALINDIIDISKIEAGKLEVYAEKFTLDALIQEAASCLMPEISRKGLDLEINLSQDMQLTTDRKRLLQCILNFLSNAVKFTEKGNIRIVAKKIDELIEIRVKDTGIGIKKEDIPRLFTSFTRLDSPLRIKAPGTGLGLYLTKKIATEMLGGSVSVESAPGKGSAFVLKIPKDLEKGDRKG